MLEKSGCFILPTMAKKRPNRSASLLLGQSIIPPKDIPAVVNEVENSELILVSTKDQMQIWNSLMINEHPQGSGPYLIGSKHGWFGGFGFASPLSYPSERPLPKFSFQSIGYEFTALYP